MRQRRLTLKAALEAKDRRIAQLERQLGDTLVLLLDAQFGRDRTHEP